jgi:hypothetical protein
LACKEVLEINDVVYKLDARPLLEIYSSPMMKGNTGAGLTCISTQQFRLILVGKRLSKLNLTRTKARGVSGNALIPDGTYLLPI